jgi:serine/threonine-protein kinase
MLGTPLYMSPEQAQGLKTVDARTDVWSLGMCLYQALAGRLPFDEVDTIGKLIVAIVAHEVPPLLAAAPWVRPELATVVHRALERDMEKRWASTRDLITALAPFGNGSVSLTSEMLVPAKEALDATLLPGQPSGPSFPAAATTAGVASDSPALPARPRRTRALPIALLGVLTAGGAVVVAMRLGSHTSAVVDRAAQPPTTSVVEPALGHEVPAMPSSDRKAGVLTVSIPDGYTIKVDGASPGGPESQGSARSLDPSHVELRGEFQTKFLVAVFDKAGRRVLVQDVYLYDNKLDPDSVDTRVGVVPVEKPRRKAPPPATPPPAQPPATPSAVGSSLPARF